MRLALILATASLLLCGCALCQRHPTTCAVAGAVVVTGAVIALKNRGGDRTPENCMQTQTCPVGGH